MSGGAVSSPMTAGGSLSVLRHLLGRVVRTMPRRTAALVGLGVAQSVLEGASLVLLLPVLGSLGIGSTDSGVVRAVRSVFAAVGVPYTLATTLAFVFFVGLLAGLVDLVQTWIADSMERRVARDLQLEAYGALVGSRSGFLSRQRMGETILALTKFTDQGAMAVVVLVRIAIACLVIASLLAVAFWQAWQFVAATGLLIALAILPIRRNFGALHRMVAACQAQVRELGGHMAEHLRLLPTVKAFGVQAQSIRMMESHVHATERLILRLRRWVAAIRSLTAPMLLGLLCLAVYAGAVVFVIPIERLLLMVGIFVRLVPNLLRVVSQNQDLPMLLNSYSQVTQLIANSRAAAEPAGGMPAPTRLVRGVELKHVRVVDGDAVILEDLSLVVPPRSLVALVGESGAGKSTIAAAILGLVQVSRGVVEVEGIDLNRLDRHEWRRRTGYVSQDMPVFSGSVRENLAFAVQEADETAMYAALEAAGVAEFVRGLPRGLDTPLGEQGSLISGGERQRVAIARALLRKPLLLILDEATSALDADMARQLMATIERLRSQAAVLVIAHDLDVVRGADLICVVDRGRIVEAGTWEELVNRRGRLFKLAVLQGRAGV